VQDFAVSGPTLTLRLPKTTDAPALFQLASDPEVTRFFSWGPYEREEQAVAYLERLPAQRQRGEHLDFVICRGGEAIGVTGLSEISARDRRGMVGTWFGRRWWGSGVNEESKALIAHVAFRLLRWERLGAYTNVLHGRSQAALQGLGFRREGVLRHWHRHGDDYYDVNVFGMLRSDWEAGPLASVPVAVEGHVPEAFVAMAAR
jgi:ribosomal-protein-alanine N-acetyltransferase